MLTDSRHSNAPRLSPKPRVCIGGVGLSCQEPSRRGREHLSLFRLAACLIGIVMLLLFPFRSAHDFNQHFRTARVRRSIISHTFVSVATEAPAKAASRLPIQPVGFVLVSLEIEMDSSAGILMPPVIPARILLLFRPGPSRASGEEPFI
jgi:hypothetical protein